MRDAKTGSTASVVVITGTDTGVGKTWLGCALSRELVRSGRRVVAIKPLETGCPRAPSTEEDGVRLARATGQSAPAHALMRFHDPVAPPEAADREGRDIDYAELLSLVRTYSEGHDVTLVEGAGGLMSPLTWKHNALDLARDLGANVILVAPDKLGTVNHSVMSLKLLALSGLDLAGLVLVAPAQPDASTGSNAAAIARLSEGIRIALVPRSEDSRAISESMQETVRALRLG